MALVLLGSLLPEGLEDAGRFGAIVGLKIKRKQSDHKRGTRYAESCDASGKNLRNSGGAMAEPQYSGSLYLGLLGAGPNDYFSIT